MTDKAIAKGKGATTNKTSRSLVKTVVLEDSGKWIRPRSGEKFFVDEDAIFPKVVFEIETQQAAPYQWSWSITWPAAVSGLKESPKRGRVVKTFSAKGEVPHRDSKTWIADLGKCIGGLLTVRVKAGTESFKRTVYVLARNPGRDRVVSFLNTMDDVKGFDRLIEQESRFKHLIEADHMPVVSFDRGYGLTQMTSPAPSYEQVWNWKENIKGGTSLYKAKQKLARSYLSQNKRSFTEDQLKLETWARWNGCSYHVWDDTAGAWVRNGEIMCDSETGNIGWNMTLADNKGKTEDDLHDRDEKSYKTPTSKKDENKWKYTGVCYADHLNR